MLNDAFRYPEAEPRRSTLKRYAHLVGFTAALTLLPLASPLTRLASALLRLPEAGSEAGLGARGSLL